MIGLALLLARALSAGTYEGTLPFGPSGDFAPPPPPADPTGQAKKIRLTSAQTAIVCTAVSLALFIIAGEGALACWCRRRARGVVPIELEHVMLPSPGDAYAGDPL
jgi:hypothetical protein